MSSKDKDKKKSSSSKDIKEKSVDKSKLDKSELKKKDKEKKDKDSKSVKSKDEKSEIFEIEGDIISQQVPAQLQQPILVQQPQPEQIDTKICVHHGTDLVYFCESCEEPICRNCTKLGPHNNQLHRINTLEEAFKSRVTKLRESIQGNLLEKRDQLLAQIHRIEYRIEEIKYVKTIIERDARNEYSGIIERLKSAEGQKLAILQHEMGELQKDLDRINDLGHTFRQFVNKPEDPIDFLIRARSLYENIEFLVAKPFKVNIEVYPYDLPRELTDMRLQLQKASAQQALIDFKNEVIWKILEERKEQEEEVKTKMEKAASEEINEWAKLVDKFSNELKRYQLICHYCGVAMDDKSINKKCQNNSRIPENFDGYTVKIPDAKYNGNLRHFFGKPKADYVDLVNTAKSQGQKNSRGKIPFIHFIEVQMNLIKKLCQERGIDLSKIFQEHDKQGKGVINQIQFAYILSEIIGLSASDSDQIRKFFDPQSKNTIEYQDILRVMDDTSLVEKIYLDESQQNHEQV
ncbi:hypothetical protein ABPG72_015873 [Tetrahymena utriculariae]